MILRSLTKNVGDQNWFAVALDFFIVVLGVFIGLQVANWNEEQTFDDRETKLLHELKKEMQKSILTTSQKINTYAQVVAAGKRSLDFLSSNVSCETECWPVLVDFMHASQWQGVKVQRSTFDNMRSFGLPRNSAVIEAVEANLAQVDAAVQAFSEIPHYRAVVRQLVSYQAQEFYWKNCFTVFAGVETYDLNCPKGVADDIALKTIEAIAGNPEIKPHLTQWVSTVIFIPITLRGQNITAEHAIATIDAELERR